MAKPGRKPISPGAVYGPYTVTGPPTGRASGSGYRYPARCRCGREYVRTSTYLGQCRQEGKPGCRACSTHPSIVPKTDRNAAVRDARAAGATVPELARAFGVSQTRIYQLLKGGGS